ncbi:two-component system regulatory protein YycI [Bacillus seohaeanensis]|jgi:regulatory protein YycI of two-component signal transduction system YycFG|uniref:Two-component system regulatory protein YycI n=1 Tax=Bacillus seohaeanensis TaxID=284580 RepID=A0ABW5RQZ6_9BACI
MDWNKTKTIFIIVFLILDIFLLSIFVQKLSVNNLEVFGETTFEERIKAEGIEYDFTNEVLSQAYISAKPKKFTEKEIASLEDQDVTVLNNTTIQSTLDEPYSLGEKLNTAELTSFVNSTVLYGDRYMLWNVNEEDQKIVYYQTYKDEPLFHNINSEITFYVNKDNEIISYKQTMLESFEEISEKEKLITPIQTLKAFYEDKKILPNSKVADPEVGYYTLLPLAESQVLTPTWHFVVEHEGKTEDLFINALNGQIIEIEQPEKESLE